MTLWPTAGPPAGSEGPGMSIGKLSLACAVGLAVAPSAAAAQSLGCAVTMPGPFRLMERQAVNSPGVAYPARTQVSVISYGSGRLGTSRAVRARVDTAEGWLFVSEVLLRGCPRGSIAERAGDVAPAAEAASTSAPATPPEPAPARACVPGATQACLCVGGRAGVQSCASTGMAWEPCACASPEAHAEPAAPESARHAVEPVAPSADERPAPAPPAERSGPTEDDVRRGMLAALDDGTARQVRSLLHPTGNGGAMGSRDVSCSGGTCVCVFAVHWRGGILGGAYRSTVRWLVNTNGTSAAGLLSETSFIRADGPHIAAMGRYLSGVAERIVTP